MIGRLSRYWLRRGCSTPSEAEFTVPLEFDLASPNLFKVGAGGQVSEGGRHSQSDTLGRFLFPGPSVKDCKPNLGISF